eukprot:IDg5118t1
MMANRGIASRTTPWIRCKTHDECISIIVNPTSSMFSTSYEIFSRHMFRQYHSACKNLEIYKTDKQMPSFAGVWRCHARPRLDEDDFKMCTVVSSDTSITAGRLSYKHHVRWKPDWSGNSSDGTLSASHRSSSASTFR